MDNNNNEMNSFNKIKLSPNMKEFRASTSYSSTKININKEINENLNQNEIKTFKRTSIELQNNTPKIIKINNEKASSNTQNVSTKEEDSSSSTFTKLPKIQKHITSATLSGSKNNFNNLVNKPKYSSNTNILNKKDKDFLSLNNNNSSSNSNMTYRTSNNSKNNTKNRSYYYKGSSKNIYNSNYILKYKNYHPLLSPPDPLLKRTFVPKVNPKFGKMKEYITLPEFRGEEPITKFEYKPILKEMLASPSIEKQYEVGLYINSTKMLNNLIYLKTQLNKDGLIILENLVNVKKLNKYYKNEYEEDEEIIQIDPEQNNFLNNDLNNPNNKNNNIIENNNNSQGNNNNESNKKIEDEFSRNNIKSGSSSTNNINHKFIKNTSFFHNKLQRPKTVYHNLKPFYTLKNKNDKTLIFESRFESGNLLCAFRTEDENSYQLYLQNDTNTTGYIQWFFFRVSNTKKGRKVNFNIINMLRKTCIYNHGLKIMTYSTMAAQKENLGWHRDCYNTIYYANNLFVYNNNNASKKRNLHSLSFDYEFKYDNDVVYFANCLPYFYSTLMKELNKYELDEDKYPFFQRKTLAMTLGGNDLDMFTINSMYDILKNGVTSIITPKSNNYSYFKNNYENNNNNSSHILDERKAVIIIGRQHPGETVGSYVVKGMYDFLMGDSDEAKKLREIYVFKIVPMMNPDGVLVGNSRTSFAGCDLNRRWTKPNEIIHPEIYSTKQMILKLSTQRNLAFIIDCHGHFGTFNSLFYCNYKENKRTCKLFPFICSKLSKIISYQQCSFSMPKYKLSTERIALFNELYDEDNNNIVALETSFFGINRAGEYARTYYNSKLLKEIGRDVCMGMLSYYYKYENMSIEPNIFSNKENAKLLDIDMREFENEMISEINEDDEDIDLNDEKSESEPSVDNLDKNQIMKLMPNNSKKRKRKKNKYKKYDKKKDNKNRDLDIELFNPLKEAKKLEEEKKKKLKSPKIIINCNFLDKKKQNIKQQTIMTDPNMKNEYTQTEEIFFKMHWSYFSGQYKILSCKKKNNYSNNNYLGFSPNLFGQLKNNINFYKRQMDINNLNYRSNSYNNKIFVNFKNGIPINNGQYNIINNINKNNIYNNYNLNMSNNNFNEPNDNIQKNKEENNRINDQSNIKLVKHQNSEKKLNIENNKYFNSTMNKGMKEALNNQFIKTTTSMSNHLLGNKSKSKNNINYNIKNGNENTIINNENNKKFYSTKYNGFNKNKISKENIKIKMAKSSSSFYKQ